MLQTLIKNKINTIVFLLITIVSFSSIYFPQTLVMNENVETIAAFEIDSSLMINSVFQHLETYNMQTGYMSRFYGWSYFFINYLVLKPIFVLQNIFGINNISFNIFIIKTIYFLISLSSCIALFFLLKKIFKKNIIAFVGCLLYILAPLKTDFFTDIKPETTGLLFLFLAQIFLINFIQDKKEKMSFWYTLGIISLTLSILAKQPFIFLVFPIIITFYWYYVEKNNLIFWHNIFTKKTFNIILKSIFLVTIITFVVYPHLFRHPINFINAQKILLKDHESSGTLVLRGIELYKAWKTAIWNTPFLKIIIFTYPIAIIITFLNKKSKLKKFFIINFLSIPVLIFIICKNCGLFINPNYLAPLLSLFLIVLFLPFLSLLKIKNKIIKYTLIVFYTYLFLLFTSIQFFNINTKLEDRKNYKQSEIIQVSTYISKEISNGSKLAISDSVLIPQNSNNKPLYESCHWWQNCSLNSYLYEFKPDYFIFIKDTVYNGIQPEYYLNYINYIKDHNFQLQTTIGKFVIYKKP